MTAPATPLSLAFVPLDRKFCAPDFRRVCFFVTPGDGSTTPHVVHAACQKSNILILLKVTAQPETWWEGNSEISVCFSRQISARVFRKRPALCFIRENNVSNRRHSNYDKCEPVILTALEQLKTATNTHSRHCLLMATAAARAIRRARPSTPSERTMQRRRARWTQPGGGCSRSR